MTINIINNVVKYNMSKMISDILLKVISEILLKMMSEILLKIIPKS